MQFPLFWTYFQGAMFTVVGAFLPQGLASLGGFWKLWRARPDDDARGPHAPSSPQDAPTDDDVQTAADAARTAGRNA